MSRVPNGQDWSKFVGEVGATQIEMDKIKTLLIRTATSVGIVAGSTLAVASDGSGFAQGSTTVQPVGLSKVDGAASLKNMTAVRNGKLILTTAQWDAVTGDTGGLVPGTTYYVAASGAITKTRPGSGNVYQIGSAKSSTEMSILLQASP